MLALADFANDDGICWPGTALLAEKINESPDYTDTIIKKCIEMGELAKHAGRGRGNMTRFAILCGLTPLQQAKLKGVLEKGFTGTPFSKSSDKRGTPKGVLLPDKRGTFSDSKQASFEAPQSDETPISEKLILHDPDHGSSDSDSAHVVLRNCGMYNGTIRQVRALGIDEPTLITSVANLVAAGWGAGAIANELRDNPPEKGHPYDKPEPDRPDRPERPAAPDSGNRYARPEKRARGSHNPSGGADVRDPGWQQREIDRIKRLYPDSDM